jgi:hypothetical protein
MVRFEINFSGDAPAKIPRPAPRTTPKGLPPELAATRGPTDCVTTFAAEVQIIEVIEQANNYSGNQIFKKHIEKIKKLTQSVGQVWNRFKRFFFTLVLF